MTRSTYNFEGGSNGANIQTGQSGSGTPLAARDVGDGSAFYSTDFAAHGTKSGKFTVGSLGYACYVGYSVSGTSVAARAYVYLTAAPATQLYLMRFNDSTGARDAYVEINGDGKLQVDAKGSYANLGASSAFPLNQWVRVEAYLAKGSTSSNGTINVAAYAADSTTPLTGMNLSSNAQNTGTGTFGAVWVGSAGSATAGEVVYVDDFAVDDASAGFIGPVSNQPPVVTAGSSQTVTTGAGFSLPFTASDPEGQTLTYTATADPSNPGSLGTLTASSTAVTGTAPADSGKYLVEIKVSDGNSSATATLTLYVTAVSATVQTIESAGGWAANTGTIPDALNDSDSGTYAESPADPAGAVLAARLTPVAGATAGNKVEFTYSQEPDTPSRSLTVELLQGSTVIASKTIDGPLPTAATNDSLTLTSEQLSAWTDRRNPILRVTAN